MLKHKTWVFGLAAMLAVTLTAVPARHGYSMDQIRSLVNKIRPGTFPELETGQKQAPTTQTSKASRGESLRKSVV